MGTGWLSAFCNVKLLTIIVQCLVTQWSDIFICSVGEDMSEKRPDSVISLSDSSGGTTSVHSNSGGELRQSEPVSDSEKTRPLSSSTKNRQSQSETVGTNIYTGD